MDLEETHNDLILKKHLFNTIWIWRPFKSLTRDVGEDKKKSFSHFVPVSHSLQNESHLDDTVLLLVPPTRLGDILQMSSTVWDLCMVTEEGPRPGRTN